MKTNTFCFNCLRPLYIRRSCTPMCHWLRDIALSSKDTRLCMCFHFRNELLDVLSLDEVAMDYVAVHYRPAIRRLPPVCWLRIKHDLNTFLEETEADNTITMRWCHSQYKEVNDDHFNSHINYSDFVNNSLI